MAFAFPTYLDDRLLADALFGRAYDALSPEQRAHVKMAIARTAAVCGSPDILEQRSVRRMRQGFSLYEADRPADWAIIFWDADYAAPTRILAAIIPAVVAGVQDILACRIVPDNDVAPFPSSVLASLELAGQELAAELSPGDAAALVEDCRAASCRGRVVILGGATYMDPVAFRARDAGVALRRMAAQTRIAVDAGSLPGDYAAEPYGMLRFAHPDAVFSLVPPQRESGAAEPFAAVLCGESAARELPGRFPLVLTPGHEACWVWPDITTRFFRDRSLGFAAFGTGCRPVI